MPIQINGFMGYLVTLIPVVLAAIAFWMRISKIPANTGGYVSNATKFVTWIFVLEILSVILLFVAEWTGVFSFPKGMVTLWGIPLLVLLYYICYLFIAFKPVTAEQLAALDDSDAKVLELSESALSGVGGILVGTLSAIWSIISEALNPIHIVKQVGSTIWYRSKTGMESLMSIVIGIGIIMAIIFVLIFLSEVYQLIAFFGMILACIIKFVWNLIRYAKGPAN